MVFHRRLCESKSPQVSRTLFSTLANLINAVVWMVSIHPLISNTSSPLSHPLWTVPHMSITIGIILFYSFLSSWPSPSTCLSFPSLWIFSLWSTRMENSPYMATSLFLLIITKLGLLARIRWSVCILKSQWVLCDSFSRTDSTLCM